MNNKILDYKQVLKKLNNIECYSNKIKREEPIGKTSYGLPILHYTVGTGKNHVVLSAAQHGCEIITTEFLINVMEKIARNHGKFQFLDKNEYTLHFLPMLNPEGYLIVTSALRKMIKKDLPNDEAQEVYNDYLDAYRKDDNDCKLKLNKKVKYHQQYFGHINPYVILNREFLNLKCKLQKIYKDGNIPEGTLVTWHSNGNGVDLNQNTPYNYKIDAIKEGKKLYSLFRYDNIETTKPGPIGCPMQGKAFKYEPENESLLKFLLDLKNNKDINFCAYFNYHSTGGLIYHKPYSNYKEVKEKEVMLYMDLEAVYNKKIAEVYATKTNYRIMDTTPTLTCFNDLLRLQIPGDLLIELSTTTANPIGPYIDETYNQTIINNIDALSFTLQKLPEMNKIKQEFINRVEQKRLNIDIEGR